MRVVRVTAWVALTFVALALCAREVARGSLLQLLLNARPGLGVLVVTAIVAAVAGILASRRHVSQRSAAAFLFGALFATGVAAQIELGARLQSDGFYYFAYLRSLAFDGDVDFSNDYKLLGLGDKPHLFEPTPTGYAQSAWTIGPAFVWAPFFAAAPAVLAIVAMTYFNASIQDWWGSAGYGGRRFDGTIPLFALGVAAFAERAAAVARRHPWGWLPPAAACSCSGTCR